MSLVFIGPPAAGKSRAGKRIARQLDATFADTDKLFAREHGAISEFIPREGEQEFRRLEREVVSSALREFEIVSLGGGAILNEDTQAELSSGEHDVVLLVANAKAIEERISGKTTRPLLSGIDSWIETYNSRKDIYERLADVTIDTSFRPMWQVMNDVRRFLKDIDSPLIAKASDEEPTEEELTEEELEPGEFLD